MNRKRLRNFLRLAWPVLSNGGRVHFEWPAGCDGWELQESHDFCSGFQVELANFHGCAFGLEQEKPWTVGTSSPSRIASMLRAHTCSHDPSHKHTTCEGKRIKKSGFYTRTMCQAIVAQVFPQKYHGVIPGMPVEPISSQTYSKRTEPWKP